MYSDVAFKRCTFIDCTMSITRNPRRRTTIRNVKLLDCKEIGCSLGPAVLEDVLIDGLTTSDLLQGWGAVFRHVTIRGRVGRIMVSPVIAPGVATASEQQDFDEANHAFYATVDWALDITEADAEELEIQGVPARLIRRDPTTQVIVKRAKLADDGWRDLDLSDTHWPTSLEFLLERGEEDAVLVAPKRHQRFDALLRGLRVLQEHGVAEPD